MIEQAANAAPVAHRAHSELGASVYKRNKACPASRAASRGMPNQTSKYAAEGTVAHALGEEALRSFQVTRGSRAWALQKAIEYLRAQIGTQREQDGFTFVISKEMVRHVEGYVRRTVDAVGEGGQLFVEERVDLSAVYPGMYGTCDAGGYRPVERAVVSRDFKFGQGVAVEDPDQMRYYGLGLILKHQLPFRELAVEIDQPRAYHADGPVRRFTFSPVDLVEFTEELRRVAVATEQPDAPFVVGDHCQFCPRSPICDALLAHIDDTITEIQAFMSAIDQAIARGAAPQYDPAKLDKLLRRIPIIASQMKRLQELATFEANQGRGSSGHKLVAGKSERYWPDEAKAKTWLQLEFGLKLDDILTEPVERKLRSPAQIEELLSGEQARKLATDETLIKKIPGGQVLAPLEDRRKAVTPLTAAQAFAGPQPSSSAIH